MMKELLKEQLNDYLEQERVLVEKLAGLRILIDVTMRKINQEEKP